LVFEGQSLETTAAGGKRRQITNLAVLVAFNIRPDLNKQNETFSSHETVSDGLTRLRKVKLAA
jgi:hypothetical protein